MTHTRIKVCGITTAEAARASADAGADAVGFVFVERSPRYIEPAEAWELVAKLPPLVASVGLFQDHSIDAFADIEQQCMTTMSQLHGSESVEVAQACGPLVIKAVRYDPATIADELARWDKVDEVEAILIDGSAGGEGESFDWAGLAAVKESVKTPIILAGGLTPDNVAEAIRTVRPYAVDVSSGVESSRGVKDAGLIARFCRAVQRADAEINAG